MKSLTVKTDSDCKRELLWCFFWTNRKAIRTEGCAPFLIEGISTSETTYAPGPGKTVTVSDGLFKSIEADMKIGKRVEFKIKIGAESFGIAFQNDVFTVSTKRHKELEEEIIESLKEDLERGKLKICPSFPQRVSVALQL